MPFVSPCRSPARSGAVLAAERKFRLRGITTLQQKDMDAIVFRCLPSTCGNAVVEADHESCNDGNRVNGDGCNQACRLE